MSNIKGDDDAAFEGKTIQLIENLSLIDCDASLDRNNMENSKFVNKKRNIQLSQLTNKTKDKIVQSDIISDKNKFKGEGFTNIPKENESGQNFQRSKRVKSKTTKEVNFSKIQRPNQLIAENLRNSESGTSSKPSSVSCLRKNVVNEYFLFDPVLNKLFTKSPCVKPVKDENRDENKTIFKEFKGKLSLVDLRNILGKEEKEKIEGRSNFKHQTENKLGYKYADKIQILKKDTNMKKFQNQKANTNVEQIIKNKNSSSQKVIKEEDDLYLDNNTLGRWSESPINDRVLNDNTKNDGHDNSKGSQDYHSAHPDNKNSICIQDYQDKDIFLDKSVYEKTRVVSKNINLDSNLCTNLNSNYTNNIVYVHNNSTMNENSKKKKKSSFSLFQCFCK